VNRTTPILLVALIVGSIFDPTVMAQDSQQLRVVEVVWGFDGRVVTGQFMPLSILVDNLSDQPIEATARLRRVTGALNEVGGISTQPVFVGPNSRRWVQFYPYILGNMATWYFDLKTEEKTYTFDPMDQPRAIFDRNRDSREAQLSLPAVILDQQGVATKSPTTIKHMPAEIFPPYATAMNGLHALFLDHAPDWEAPRQQALLSWLKSGGQLHLMKDGNNQTLSFSGILAPLNEPFPEFPVGNGLVTRHDFQRDGLSLQVVTPVVTPPGLTQDVAEPEQSFNQIGTGGNTAQEEATVNDDEILMWMRELTQPDHAWILIFLLSMCYVGLIFPGCWILSKQRRLHFLVTYGAIAGLAVFFSLIFLFVGQRGYGETTSLHTLAVARAEDATHWSSLEYRTLFVTSGDLYTLDDKDRQTLLASGAADERADAVMTSGNSASFVARVPPFSSQSMIFRRRLTMDDWNLTIANVEQNGSELTALTLSFNEKFPLNKDNQYFVVHGKRIHMMKADDSRKQLTYAGNASLLTTFCSPVQEFDDGFAGILTPGGIRGSGYPDEANDLVAECFQKSLLKLVARSAADDFYADLKRFELPEGRVRILIYAPFPATQDMTVSSDVKREGRILYVRDFPMQIGDSNAVPGEVE
jgi:hypothetical protein